jgi:threonine/homoserine/homoserine lactone efflux protein
VLLFLGVSALVIAIPGQDTALTIRNTLLGNRATGLATALGVGAGQSVVVTRARSVFDRRRVRRAVDAVAGTVLVAFGLRLAAERP